MNTTWTVDHRFGDAAIACSFIKIVKGFTEDTENFNLESYPDNTSYTRPAAVADKKK